MNGRVRILDEVMRALLWVAIVLACFAFVLRLATVFRTPSPNPAVIRPRQEVKTPILEGKEAPNRQVVE